MSILQQNSSATSNDLLESLIAEHTPAGLNYQIAAKSAEDAHNIENAPAVSMEPGKVANHLEDFSAGKLYSAAEGGCRD